MRNFAALLVLVFLTAGCSSTPVHQASPPSTVVGTWQFSITGDEGSYSSTFMLTDVPAETCISGNWYRAQPVSPVRPQVSRPAYSYEAGRLELLLSSELCDAYSSFIGKVAGSHFTGSHVSYGLFGSTEHGKVKGALRP